MGTENPIWKEHGIKNFFLLSLFWERGTKSSNLKVSKTLQTDMKLNDKTFVPARR